MSEYALYYLIGAFLAFTMVLGEHYKTFYPYEEPEIETMFQEHPETRKSLIIATLLSWIYVILYTVRYFCLWIKNKFK